MQLGVIHPRPGVPKPDPFAQRPRLIAPAFPVSFPQDRTTFPGWGPRI